MAEPTEVVPTKQNPFDALAIQTKKTFPRFRIVERDRSWLRPIFWCLEKITRRSYAGFTTTVFSTMYVGSTWQRKTEVAKYRTLRHEKIHIHQFYEWPFGRRFWLVNHLLTALCYLFVLPVFWTLRSKFEREGYTQTLLVEYELEGKFDDDRLEENAQWLAKTFGTSTYLWMWSRGKAYSWALDTQYKIMREEISNPRDRVT